MIAQLEDQLNDFSIEIRVAALRELLDNLYRDPSLIPEQRNAVNMHCHSFYSFNAYGYSPTALVWLAKKLGLQVAGIVDFDNLDGVDEFLSACDLACLRGSAAMETRIYIPELAKLITNSPGEPGISYATGIGFASSKVNVAGTKVLNAMRARADQRNRDMVGCLNSYLDPVAIDYDGDVLPLTPAGNATERHILTAYLNAVNNSIKKPVEFWAQKLGQNQETISDLMHDPAAFSDSVRRKLMKIGGVGYVQPGPDTFPLDEEFYQMVISNGALPTYNYLNGATDGEQHLEEVLDMQIKKGIAAYNLIPNLAVPDPSLQPGNAEIREEQTRRLIHNANLALAFDLPLHIGTEMNSFGQRKMDDLNSPELFPLKKQILDGSYFIYGHVKLHHRLGIGFQSRWAKSFLPKRADRNSFFTQAGYLITPGDAGITQTNNLHASMSPREILSKLRAE